ncbi:MAG: glycosyltransferase family 2 protein [Treponema sp.]|nr:glycosyltransferase family 2 protein [Treponema sp.]
MSRENLLILVPTYDEAENIEKLLTAIFDLYPQREVSGVSVLVIDDNSPDGTAAIVEGLMGKYEGRLHLLKRAGKAGLAKAYLAGFEWGLERGFGEFLEMDADLSHDPKYLPEMIAQIQSHDVAIGSRNVKGGGAEGWPFSRTLISKGGSLYARAVLGCPIKDLTGGFNMWTAEALEKIGLDRIISQGYLFQVEMKYRAWKAGCSVKEIPIIFRDRTLGASKMSKKILFEALLKVWDVRLSAAGATGEFLKFAIVGALGAATNLLLFFALVDLLGLAAIPVSVGCFWVAGTQNYALNGKWTFAGASAKLSVKKWLAFLAASLVGLGANLAVMQAMISLLNLPFKFIAQACGIVAGMALNFVFSKFLVFRKKA